MIDLVALLAVTGASPQEAPVLWSGDCEIQFKDRNGSSSMPVQYGWTEGEKIPFITIPSGTPIDSGKYFLNRTLIPEAEGKRDPDIISSLSEVKGQLGKVQIAGLESFKLHRSTRMIELKYFLRLTFDDGTKREGEMSCSLPYSTKGGTSQ